jgi:hypothetical protein
MIFEKHEDGKITLTFKCDRCPNEVPFYHATTTFIQDSDPSKSYCSEICVRAVIEAQGLLPYKTEFATVFP